MKNIVKTKSEILTYVDSKTGEVLEQEVKTHIKHVDKSKFCLAYASLWDVFMDSNLTNCDKELLAYLIQKYANSTIFSISRDVKEQVSLISGRNKISAYANSTKRLVKAGAIIRRTPRTYVLNPQLAFEGGTKERDKVIIELHKNRD